MDIELYNQLLQYLSTQHLPTNFNNQQKKNFITKAKQFQLQNQLLYKIDKRKENNLLRVIRNFEMESVLFMMHNDPLGGHFAMEIMFNKIKT